MWAGTGQAVMHYFIFFNAMLFQEAKAMDFHVKFQEIINVGKKFRI